MKIIVWFYTTMFFLLQSNQPLMSFSSFTQHLYHNSEAIALLQFKSSVHIKVSNASLICNNRGQYSYPKTASWNETSSDCCTWDGIICDDITGHVLGIDLSCSQLQGNISVANSGGLFNLSHLQKLNLAYNDFSGSEISPYIASLTSLRYLNLSSSNYSGQIPSGISHLSKLVSLDLSGNGYGLIFDHQDFQELVQNLSQIRVLSLSNLNVSSELPKNFSASLTHLDLSMTRVYGKETDHLFHLPNLQYLSLSGTDLTSSLPNFNCSSFPTLQFLNLSLTNFSGQIPDSIACLKSLNVLLLNQCHFNGFIPESIGNLTHLTTLSLASNSFSGAIPSRISNLLKLEVLDLKSNQLEGQIPNSFTFLQNLIHLSLDNNLLHGPVPSWLFCLQSLQVLQLRHNRFTGQLPEFEEFKGSKFLEQIDLSNNQIHGPIPNSISRLQNLTILVLSSNNFSGGIGQLSSIKLTNLVLSDNPLSWGVKENVNISLPNLEHLDFSSCEIHAFPEFLSHMKNLSFLQLSNNKIKGQIPSWLASLPLDSLAYLNLSHNSLSGIQPLPWKNLRILDLHSNQIQGPLPHFICNFEALTILDLSNNTFSGAIPNCFGNFSNQLLVLNLGKNRLQHAITLTFAKDSMLRNVALYGNLLEGPLPQSLANCKQLQVLDVGNNNISDTFPTWLEDLKELRVLILKSNKFFGPIKNFKTKIPFPSMQIFDLSCNEFSGVLPEKLIQSFKAMMTLERCTSKAIYLGTTDNITSYQYAVNIVVKGAEITKVLIVLSTIDLSSNKFHGSIPQVIGDLISLKFLNLSNNYFSGMIPSAIGKLHYLESLDLSWNQIEGEIPTKITNLTFLLHLNLSENHLVGRIPRGNQFNLFGNDSYRGNLALCGFPLSKDCGDIDISGFEEVSDHSEFFDGFTWKAVLTGYGFGLGLGLSTGCLMFLIGKPRWFIQIVGKQLKLRRKSRKWIHIQTWK